MEGITRDIVYFRYCGEVNTEDLLHLARGRCELLGIRTMVIASETGRSALRAVEILRGTDVQIVVVTHYPATTWGPKGDMLVGLKRPEYAETLKRLLESGAHIVQSSRPLAPPSRTLGWGFPTPEGIMDKTLELFGAGTKIAIEATIMATDAGEVSEGEEIVSCAGTFKGLDTALVVRATYSMNLFKNFKVMEIVAMPCCRLRKLPEYECEDWRGDLDQYY